jgi:hypothetical protein
LQIIFTKKKPVLNRLLNNLIMRNGHIVGLVMASAVKDLLLMESIANLVSIASALFSSSRFKASSWPL